MEVVMAVTHRDFRFGLTRHRQWEDIASVGIAAVVLVAPMFVPSADVAVNFSAGLAACLIAALGLLEMVSLRRWEEVLELGCGAWLIVAPFALGYGGEIAAVHMVAGAGVCALALLELWQDWDRDLAQ
jgi:hypothetical protein